MTKEEVISYFNLKCNTNNYKVGDKLILEDEEGYMFYLSVANLKCQIKRNGSLNRFFGGNPFTEKNIKTYISKQIGDHIEIKDFNNAKTAKSEILIRCNKHNIEYYKCWNVIKNGQYCNECGMERYRKNRSYDINYIKHIATEKYGITIVDSKYVNNNTPLSFICNKHRERGEQKRSWSQIISSKHSCAYCAKESQSKNSLMSKEDYRKKSEMLNTKIDLIGEYTGCKNYILVKCKKCGEKLEIRADHILSGVGCSKCFNSNGEARIKEVFNKYNTKYIFQYKFGDCICNKRDMAFDFYLQEQRVAIEYDGIQHFEPVKIFGGIEQFKIQQRNDCFKTEYCNKNNIRLIRIPYWEFENIESILIKELNLQDASI